MLHDTFEVAYCRRVEQIHVCPSMALYELIDSVRIEVGLGKGKNVSFATKVNIPRTLYVSKKCLRSSSNIVRSVFKFSTSCETDSDAMRSSISFSLLR